MNNTKRLVRDYYTLISKCQKHYNELTLTASIAALPQINHVKILEFVFQNGKTSCTAL